MTSHDDLHGHRDACYRAGAADALREAADAWGADPDSVGDTARDYRNWLRDRATLIERSTS